MSVILVYRFIYFKGGNTLSKIKISLLAFVFVLLATVPGFSGGSFRVPVSDTSDQILFGFFDLRERETFIQVTNVDTVPAGNNVHIQIYDVSNNCNENNFFDLYTVNDTHVYNLRDIKTNDGNDSGVVLPDGAYGVFVAYGADKVLIGNLRILDNNGYEYRTNLQGTKREGDADLFDEFATFNFNTKGEVTLSDIVLISLDENETTQDAEIADILDQWTSVDVNIFDINENPFSCRKVIFSCINQDSPLYETLLEEVANSTSGGCVGGDCAASVADIEYGINNAIPHSKGGELLCPGNNITEGFVRLEQIGNGSAENDAVVFVGLNNGNGRGSMDSFLNANSEVPKPQG